MTSKKYKYDVGTRVLVRVKEKVRTHNEYEDEYEEHDLDALRIVEITHHVVDAGVKYAINRVTIIDESDIIRVVTDQEMKLRRVQEALETAVANLSFSVMRCPEELPLRDTLVRLHDETKQALDAVVKSYE